MKPAVKASLTIQALKPVDEAVSMGTFNAIHWRQWPYLRNTDPIKILSKVPKPSPTLYKGWKPVVNAALSKDVRDRPVTLIKLEHPTTIHFEDNIIPLWNRLTRD